MEAYVNISTGVRLHYEHLGQGAPVVTVHGWLGTPRRDLGTVNDWLATSYQVYSPTLRGFGQSRPPQRDFPIDFYERDADDILAFMDALGIEKVHLLGYSDGGEAAIIAAGKQPERFQSVIVWGAVGYFGEAMRPAAERLAPATFLENKPDEMAMHGITDAKAFVADWISAVVGLIDRGGDVSVGFAPQITAPLLLMLGDQDTLNPQEYGQRLADMAPNGQLMMVDDSPHEIQKHQFEILKTQIAQFLETNS